jgi:hypothetical protein
MKLSELSDVSMKVFVGVSVFGIVIGATIFVLEAVAKLAR